MTLFSGRQTKNSQGLLKFFEEKVLALENKIQKLHSKEKLNQALNAEIIALKNEIEAGLKNQILGRQIEQRDEIESRLKNKIPDKQIEQRDVFNDEELAKDRAKFHSLLEKLQKLQSKIGIKINQETDIKMIEGVNEKRIFELANKLNTLIIENEKYKIQLKKQMDIEKENISKLNTELESADKNGSTYIKIQKERNKKCKMVGRLRVEAKCDMPALAYQTDCFIRLIKSYTRQETQEKANALLEKIGKSLPLVQDLYNSQMTKIQEKEERFASSRRL